MSEPLLLCAEATLSASAWRRWLKSAAGADDGGRCEVSEQLLAVAMASLDDGISGLFLDFAASAQRLRVGIVLADADTAATQAQAADLLACLQAMATRRHQPQLWREGSDEWDAPDAWPDWFSSWLGELAAADTPEQRLAWLEPSLRRTLMRRVSLGALTASPQTPFIYDLHYFTDGRLVLPQGEAYHAMRAGEPYAHWALADADPRSFRRLAGDPFHGEAFYADCRQLWFSSFFSTRFLFEHGGAPLKGMREDPDSPCFLLCGDTLWSPVASRIPQTAAALSQLRVEIAAVGGMVLNEARSDDTLRIVDWLQALPVDGASFKYVGSSLFRDCQHLYAHDLKHGSRVVGPVPDDLCKVGEFLVGGQAVYLFGRELVGADAGSFEALAFPFARDCRHVWYRDRILPDLDPADLQLSEQLARLQAEQGLY